MGSKGSSLKWLAALGAAGVMAACGGGGGGGGGGAADDDFDASDYPTPPATAGSGLEAPSRVLTGERAEAVELLRNLSIDAWPELPEAVGLQVLGTVSPTMIQTGAGGTYACAAGGTIGWAGGGTSPLSVTYNNCVIGGYTFNGDATVASTAVGYDIGFTGLSIAGLGIDAPTVEGATECQVNATTGALLGCVSRYPSGSPVEKENFVWGWDSRWDGTTAEGTHQCGCTRTWNVGYAGYTASSGKAVIAGSNGVAYVNRRGTNLFDVRVVINGGTPVSYIGVSLAR